MTSKILISFCIWFRDALILMGLLYFLAFFHSNIRLMQTVFKMETWEAGLRSCQSFYLATVPFEVNPLGLIPYRQAEYDYWCRVDSAQHFLKLCFGNTDYSALWSMQTKEKFCFTLQRNIYYRAVHVLSTLLIWHSCCHYPSLIDVK